MVIGTRCVAVFDLDGTLTDPLVGICSSVGLAMESHGYRAPSTDEVRRVIGPPLHEAMTELGLNPLMAEAFRDRIGSI